MIREIEPRKDGGKYPDNVTIEDHICGYCQSKDPNDSSDMLLIGYIYVANEAQELGWISYVGDCWTHIEMDGDGQNVYEVRGLEKYIKRLMSEGWTLFYCDTMPEMFDKITSLLEVKGDNRK